MSGKRRRARVSKNLKKDSNVLVVLVEGQTEKNYLEHLKSVYNSKIKLKILQQSTLKKDFKSTISRFSNNIGIDEDELILIYDLENCKEEYETFIKDGQLKHEKTYLIQPCIELHFLLHYEHFHWSRDTYYPQKDLLFKLNEILPKYKKGRHFAWSQHISEEHLELARLKSIQGFKHYDDASFSMLGMFIDQHLIK